MLLPLGLTPVTLVQATFCAEIGVALEVGVGEGSDSGALGSGQTKAPRLRVHSDNRVPLRSILMSQIMTLGAPFWKRCQIGLVALMLLVKYSPKSVPAKTCAG